MMSTRRSEHRKGNQFGFTLIEILVALLVGSMILAAVTATLNQVFSNNSRNQAHMIAVKQIENAIYFLERDIQQAQTIQTTGLGANEVLRLTWVTWDSVTNQVIYNWNASDHRLTRTKLSGGDTITVAYSIDPQPTFDTSLKGKVIFTMTSSVQGAHETRVVGITSRSGT